MTAQIRAEQGYQWSCQIGEEKFYKVKTLFNEHLHKQRQTKDVWNGRSGDEGNSEEWLSSRRLNMPILCYRKKETHWSFLFFSEIYTVNGWLGKENHFDAYSQVNNL